MEKDKDYPDKGTDRDKILWEIENIDHRIKICQQEINILNAKRKNWMEIKNKKCKHP